MTYDASLPYLATLGEYQRQAEALLAAVQSGDNAARWRFKWEHPRYHGKTVDAVDPATLEIGDAQAVVAHQYGFETWEDLRSFTVAIQHDRAVARFESAVEAVVSGDLVGLGAMLRETPELACARSMRRHRATLLHYLGANGVEGGRQKTPGNAVEVAKTLLDAGAEVDAPMYGAKCTTMTLLVSSSPAYQAGLQAALAETLLDYGAALEGPGTKWQSAFMTALAFGYLSTAEALARRGARVEHLAAAAGLGHAEAAAGLLAAADAQEKHIALALAAQHGHVMVVNLLLDAGEDPNRYNPQGFHAHSTPLHQAVWSNHAGVVALLVERGARLDIQDTIYGGTPLDWANYGGRTAIAEYLRSRGAPTA